MTEIKPYLLESEPLRRVKKPWQKRVNINDLPSQYVHRMDCRPTESEKLDYTREKLYYTIEDDGTLYEFMKKYYSD